VVSEQTGLPGKGFIGAEDIPKAQIDVFSYDWIAHGSPAVDDFETSDQASLTNNAK